MRTAAPLSLQVVSVVVCGETDNVQLFGPFSSVAAMNGQLTGVRYPDGTRDEPEIIVAYKPSKDRWETIDGSPVLIWSVDSLDNLLHCGSEVEQERARYIMREFPSECSDSAKEGGYADR